MNSLEHNEFIHLYTNMTFNTIIIATYELLVNQPTEEFSHIL